MIQATKDEVHAIAMDRNIKSIKSKSVGTIKEQVQDLFTELEDYELMSRREEYLRLLNENKFY